MNAEAGPRRRRKRNAAIRVLAQRAASGAGAMSGRADMADDTIELLKSLHTRAVDARKGYEEARDDADGRGLTPLFREMIALHETNAGELSAYLLRAGTPANEDGSFMSVIHRTIMDVRSFFNALGESVLPGLIDGEERNKSSYDRALELPDLPADVRGVLTRQRDRIAGAIARMQTMKQTHAAATG